MLRSLWAPLHAPQPAARGGWRQQLERLPPIAGAGEEPVISQLAADLLLDWSEGVLSASKLQRHFFFKICLSTFLLS